MNFPDHLLYTKDHEWAMQKDAIVVVGITDYAQDQLGDIVYIELPAPGTLIEQGKEFGVIESVKAVSDLYAPVSGEVIKVNEALKETPEILNQNPYDQGWMIQVKMKDARALKTLLNHTDYQKLIHD